MKSKPTWSRRRAFHRFKVALRPLPKGFSGVGREPRRARRLVPLAHAVGQGTFLPRPACVVRVANQLRGGGSYRRAVARHRGPPDRSQRAQRAQLVSAEAGSVPCPSAHSSASSTLPPAISAKAARLPGAARRCGSPHWPWCGGWARKEARKSCKSCKYPGLRRNTWQWREPAGPTGDRNDAHAASEEHVPNRDGSLRHPRTLGPHDGRKKPRTMRRSARARCWYLPGGLK